MGRYAFARPYTTHNRRDEHRTPQAAGAAKESDLSGTPQRAIAPPPRPHTKRVPFCAVVQGVQRRAGTGLSGVLGGVKNCANLGGVVQRFLSEKKPAKTGKMGCFTL
jgi:hypothetical protein